VVFRGYLAQEVSVRFCLDVHSCPITRSFSHIDFPRSFSFLSPWSFVLALGFLASLDHTYDPEEIFIWKEVSRLQEQLQTERDLRAALEVGLSMSSGQFSSSRSMDSKTRAELEEIALAEADVARLKKKVAELHLQLNQQRQHRCSFVSDDIDHYQNFPAHLCQPKVVQQDFDTSLAFLSHEKKQRNENLSGSDWRSIMPPQALSFPSNYHPSYKKSLDGAPSDTKGVEASSSMSSSETNPLKLAEGPESLKHPAVASSTLMELTTRLDFFKERRSQLLEQLHNLELSHGISSSQGFAYNPSSPSWNSPR
ncbi:rho GTPase-activating protein 7-like, partial [Phalaenopsis equestris]|uniref:rho GTPase-activating protein 7-like n=1 Tax=Phalaenopsis equestris TaxID=78828 RepID=UPI0009E4A01E